MSKLFTAMVAITLLTGCAREAHYVDQEWGKAQMASWDSLVANPMAGTDGGNPTGMEGVNAEEVMAVYNRSFTEKSTKTEIFELGVTSESGQ